MIAIIGAGITGLSAGVNLTDAIVFEKSSTPGGLVGTFCFDGYYYDKTVHFLMLKDQELKDKVFSITGDIFRHSPLVVWVETQNGTVRYPFQLNIGGLPKEEQIKIISGFYKSPKGYPKNYREFLLSTFGEGMCNEFFFPYNEKNWKYPLDDMTAEGTWNIHRPTIEDILEGVFYPNQTRGDFNTSGYYPVLEPGSRDRGIGLVSKRFAQQVNNLHLNSEVVSINAREQTMVVREGINTQYAYDSIFSTIPLPKLMGLFVDLPAKLRNDIRLLKSLRMTSVAVSVVGERPENPGHYRYYTDPSIPFNKVVFMTEFDPYSAPSFGFGLLLELKETTPDNRIIIESLRKLGILKDHKVVGIHSWPVDPAYVIFTHNTWSIVENCTEWLAKHNVITSGRYGKWEYSSMAENIKDGFDYAVSVPDGL